MSPRSQVLVKFGERKGQAGVVEVVKLDKAKEPVEVSVRMDVDGQLETFHPEDLDVLRAH